MPAATHGVDILGDVILVKVDPYSVGSLRLVGGSLRYCYHLIDGCRSTVKASFAEHRHVYCQTTDGGGKGQAEEVSLIAPAIYVRLVQCSKVKALSYNQVIQGSKGAVDDQFKYSLVVYTD